MTGGWAAKELCEKGLKTLVLERGRHVEHGKDYVTEWLQPWQLPHRGRGEQALYERDYPIQSKNYAFGETTRHFFVNDREHPYVTPDDQPLRDTAGRAADRQTHRRHRRDRGQRDLRRAHRPGDGRTGDRPQYQTDA